MFNCMPFFNHMEKALTYFFRIMRDFVVIFTFCCLSRHCPHSQVLVEALAAAYSNIKEQFRIDSKTFKADEVFRGHTLMSQSRLYRFLFLLLLVLMICPNIVHSQSYLSEQLGKYQFLLQEFDDKIEALKHVPLHPALTKHFFQNQPTIISSDIPMPESGSAMDSIKNNPSATENNNIGMDEVNIQRSGASNSSPSMLDPNSCSEHTGAPHPSGRYLKSSHSSPHHSLWIHLQLA